MKLITIGTGSSGNTYLLTNGSETLVIDAGMPFLEVKKALNFNIRSIRGAVVSHIHGDHNKYSHEYESAGIPVFRPYMTESLRMNAGMGGFTVRSFGVIHNVPCCGFLIEHPDMGKLLYATDTEYVPYRFKDLSTMLIEANYSEEYVNRNEAKYAHVLTGHMSLETCLDCIKANDNQNLKHIILCHLSFRNSHPQAFKKAVEDIVSPEVTVDIATKGKSVSLGGIPF